MATRSESRTALGMILAGTLITLASATVGFVWLNDMPDLDPVPLGEPVHITATTDETTIFTSIGQSATPTCQAAAQDGTRVTLGEPTRYLQSTGMESSQGFTTNVGTTYTVVCGDAGQPGQFAVAEIGDFPEAQFLAVGSAGLLLSATGGVMAWRGRRTPVSSLA